MQQEWTPEIKEGLGEGSLFSLGVSKPGWTRRLGICPLSSQRDERVASLKWNTATISPKERASMQGRMLELYVQACKPLAADGQ